MAIPMSYVSKTIRVVNINIQCALQYIKPAKYIN